MTMLLKAMGRSEFFKGFVATFFSDEHSGSRSDERNVFNFSAKAAMSSSLERAEKASAETINYFEGIHAFRKFVSNSSLF